MKLHAMNIKAVYDYAVTYGLEEEFPNPRVAEEERYYWIRFLESRGFKLVKSEETLPSLYYEHPDLKGGIMLAADFVDWYKINRVITEIK
jgi:hypothetical protein